MKIILPYIGIFILLFSIHSSLSAQDSIIQAENDSSFVDIIEEYYDEIPSSPDSFIQETTEKAISIVLEYDIFNKRYVRLILPIMIALIIYYILCIALLSIFIFIHRWYYQRREIKTERYKKFFAEQISHYLFAQDAKKELKHIEKMVRRPLAKRIFIEESVILSKSVIGNYRTEVLQLLRDLKMDEFIKKHVNSFHWYAKFRCIHTFALMDIHDESKRLENYAQSKNRALRQEAQLALINYDNEESFRFLYDLKEPLTNWQQLNIYDSIIRHSISPPEFAQWLDSLNLSVIIFCLKMIGAFRQDITDERLSEFLMNDHPAIRHEAILTCNMLKKEGCSSTLINIFEDDTRRNQIAILECLQVLRCKSAMNFLTDLLNHESTTIKLEAAQSIKSMGFEGMKILREIKEDTSDKQITASINHVLDKRI